MDTSPQFTALPPDADAGMVLDRARALAARLETTVIARDAAGGHAAEQRALIRASGLLHLTIARAHGGMGHSWQVFFRTLHALAQADSALAHLFAFHHLQALTLTLYGSAAQQQHYLGMTIADHVFWGNALNPNDRRTVASAHPGGDGFVLHGPKSWCSGSVGADWLVCSGWHEATQSLVVGVLPASAPGLRIEGDWDAFGQKQTDSGTVTFEQVHLARQAVVMAPAAVLSPRATVRALVAQLILATLYAGIARGALDHALAHTTARSKPWFASGVARAADDPFVQHRYGELSVLVRPAEVMVDRAAQAIDLALAQGDALTAAGRGDTAIAVAEAKVVAHRAALEVSSQMFELTGANAASSRFGLDRFWRNARVHTLHDPVDYKLRDLGRHALDGRFPDPTSYS